MSGEATGSTAARQARQLLLIQHSAQLPVRSRCFRWPASSALLLAQPFLANDLGFKDRAPSAFDRSFLKELIARLEEAVREAQSRGDEDAEVSEPCSSVEARGACVEPSLRPEHITRTYR